MPIIVKEQQPAWFLQRGAPAEKPRRSSAPSNGISLAAATEMKGKPIREAVAALSSGFVADRISAVFSKVFGARWALGTVNTDDDTVCARAAWALVSVWLLAKARDDSRDRPSILTAERWFRGQIECSVPFLAELTSADSLWETEQILGTVNIDAEFWDLLPYILEEHGPGSRASVMRDPSTAFARSAKRASGVFYTPSDVADYMVEHTCELYCGDFWAARALDPACGTGVFLLAMLRAAARHAVPPRKFSLFEYVISNLHGFDISGQALNSAAFVLLKECLTDVFSRGLTPLAAWHSIRMNLVEIDALGIDPFPLNDSRTVNRYTSERHRCREMLLDSSTKSIPLPFVIECSSTVHGTPGYDLFESASKRLTAIFPHADGGFDVLIGNPPYAVLGARSDFQSLACRLACLRGMKPAPRLNMFPLFVEMMWQLTRPKRNAAALVTPLSIAFHSGTQYENCRNAMSWNGGHWQFAFFDREPHALFGEEIKTRNAILFRFENAGTPERGQAAEIETGPLRKWTSRTRASLFKSIEFTPIDSINLLHGIPKIAGMKQAEAFIVLRRRVDRLPSLPVRMGSCSPVEALDGFDRPAVFVGGTAYNFLNVYRPVAIPLQERDLPISDSAVHCLEFKSETEARLALTILSSRLVFWLWHVLGDGFHVASWLFEEVPFSGDSFKGSDRARLSELGDQLWRKLQNHRFVSLNRGKQTFGFRPLSCDEERDAIDALLISAAGLDHSFCADLKRFVHENAVVDASDARRNHVKQHFGTTTTNEPTADQISEREK